MKNKVADEPASTRYRRSCCDFDKLWEAVQNCSRLSWTFWSICRGLRPS